MKKNILKISFIGILALSAGSCTRDFEKTNTDFSKNREIESGTLLTPALFEMASQAYMRADDFTFDIMQYSLPFPSEGNSYSRYYLTENSGVGYWNNSYRWLKQLKEMKQLAQKENNANNFAVASIIEAWGYANLTDSFGNIPMSQANDLENNIDKPKFDTQKEIYLQLLNSLDEANAKINTGEKLNATDCLFKANESAEGMLKWKKFANSLSMRLLLRILDRDGEIDVKARINKIISNPLTYPLFESISDDAKVDVSGVAPYVPPMARPQDFTTGRAAAEFFVDYLNKTNDPRLSKFFSKAKNLSDNKDIGYKGIPSGYKAGTAFDYQPSNLQQNLAKAPLKLTLMNYSELMFIKSELAMKGIIPGDAKAFYNAGVKASIEQWGSTMSSTYTSNALVAYNGTLERIMMQKYVALFFVDQQAWYEHRRTGYPVLPNNGGLQNNGVMPSRFMYPPASKLLNADHYNAAIKNMGGDDINTKVWWDK